MSTDSETPLGLGGKCGYGFCWHCFVSYQLVLVGDNSAHEGYCRFHPSNMDGFREDSEDDPYWEWEDEK